MCILGIFVLVVGVVLFISVFVMDIIVGIMFGD